MPLEREVAYFEFRRQEWVAKYPGEFMVVQDEMWDGPFQSWEEAFRAGLARFGVDRPFLVKEALEHDRVEFIGGS